MLPAYEELAAEVATLKQNQASLLEENHSLREENQALRDEVARLKGQKGKPSIKPSQLNQKDRNQKKRERRKIREGKLKRQINRTEIVKAQNVPAGSRFKGYTNFDTQELVIKTETIRYRLEKWITPDGKLITATMPLKHNGIGSHFGNTLQSFILYQYYHALVTEPLLLEQLHEFGVQISSGQLHRLITEGKEKFHQEKDEILRVGLRVSNYIHVDDTGARHQGKNGFCTHIGNELFAYFESTASKNRINFLKLLRSGHTDFVIDDAAFEYMVGMKLPKQLLKRIEAEVAGGELVFADETLWQAALERWKIAGKHHVRIVTEGALIGSVLSHGINTELAIISDDAGQFNVLIHALCWVHAERVLAKLVGFNDEQRVALEKIRNSVWELYRELKVYKTAPTDKARSQLEKRFDELCATKTCFTSLNLALKRMASNKRELLLVLERPEIPLNNNLSEGDIREYVKRRKISGGTRNEDGRRCRDTFASAKKTCRKLGVSFWEYLKSRLHGEDNVPILSSLIKQRAQAQV
jgi:hypothetical protein